MFACAPPPDESAVLEGVRFEWDWFNHRVSSLDVAVRAAGDEVGRDALFAVVGGTSTTGTRPELAPTCDPETCQEFPFVDEASVHIDAAWVSGGHYASGSAAAVILTGSEVEQTLEIPLTGALRGEDVVAVVRRVRLDTDVPLADGQGHCYDPANGWHPRRMGVWLTDARRVDDRVVVTIHAAFEAGNSLEPERVCVDEVAALARAQMIVEVSAFAAPDLKDRVVLLEQGLSYDAGDVPFDPAAQPPPIAADRPLDLVPEGAVVGWSAIDFRFHVEDPESRGAYLRGVELIAGEGLASGHAWNYSPGTQLSGFDYSFRGEVHVFEPPGAVIERRRLEGHVPVLLDSQGDAVAFSLMTP